MPLKYKLITKVALKIGAIKIEELKYMQKKIKIKKTIKIKRTIKEIP